MELWIEGNKVVFNPAHVIAVSRESDNETTTVLVSNSGSPALIKVSDYDRKIYSHIVAGINGVI